MALADDISSKPVIKPNGSGSVLCVPETWPY